MVLLVVRKKSLEEKNEAGGGLDDGSVSGHSFFSSLKGVISTIHLNLFCLYPADYYSLIVEE